MAHDPLNRIKKERKKKKKKTKEATKSESEKENVNPLRTYLGNVALLDQCEFILGKTINGRHRFLRCGSSL
jgi:hypothetical protein